jgi:LPPG:FO 2-phospho-L-lactate transferase
MKLVAFAGGVGGAKLVDGLAQILTPENLSIIVNTGDDFEYLGLYVSPDLDTVCYTLAGLANPETGWGRSEESFTVLDNIATLGGPEWFHVGDKDFATHIERTFLINNGLTLSQITRQFCHNWGVEHDVRPMSDQPVRTLVNTIEYGELEFQEYFVHRRCEPTVQGFRFAGIESALPSPGTIESIKDAEAVIFCPSNPWVSIDPILSVGGIRDALRGKPAVAVSPIIGGETIKGPAAKMYREMGIQPSANAVSDHYSGLLTGFIYDATDAGKLEEFSIPTKSTQTIMREKEDRRNLAQFVIDFINEI